MLRTPDPDVPIAAGTRSPRVMRLAGELADIALVGARYLTPQIVTVYRAWLEEGAAVSGRTLATLEVLPCVTLCVCDDAALAVESIKRYAAHYLDLLGSDGPALPAARREFVRRALTRATGWYFALDRYDPPGLSALIDPELARCFAVAGTPAQCTRQLRGILDLGFSGVSCNLAALRRASMCLGLRETLVGATALLKAPR